MAIYPQLREIIREALEQYTTERGLPQDEAIKAVAQELAVSQAALKSWRNGNRRPPDETIVLKLAEVLLPSASDRQTFLAKWASAKEQKITAWADRVAMGRANLHIKQADYAGAGDFWAEVFAALLDYARVAYSWADQERLDFLQVRDMLWAPGKLDVALGILATPEMLVKLRFIPSPVRYRVNAVGLRSTLKETDMDLREIRQALAPDPLSTSIAHRRKRLSSRFQFAAMKGEVGHIYAERILREKMPDLRLVRRLDATKYADLMIHYPRTLALADEVTCLQVISRLRMLGAASFLVFPLRTGAPHEIRDPGSLLPEFPLGLAVSRNIKGDLNTRDLTEFIDEALWLFLNSNARWVASCYLKLRDQVRNVAKEALLDESPQTVERWLNYSFRLSEESVVSEERSGGRWSMVLRNALALDAARTAGS